MRYLLIALLAAGCGGQHTPEPAPTPISIPLPWPQIRPPAAFTTGVGDPPAVTLVVTPAVIDLADSVPEPTEVPRDDPQYWAYFELQWQSVGAEKVYMASFNTSFQVSGAYHRYLLRIPWLDPPEKWWWYIAVDGPGGRSVAVAEARFLVPEVWPPQWWRLQHPEWQDPKAPATT